MDITRQVIFSDEDDEGEEAIWQLHLTYRYSPGPELQALGSGNKWCSSPAELGEFEAFIALLAAVEHCDKSSEILFESAE